MGKNYKILTAKTRIDLEGQVERQWTKGFRPVGNASFSREEPSITTRGLWIQAMARGELLFQSDVLYRSYLDGEVTTSPEDET